MSVDTDSSVDSDTNSSDTNISDNQLHNISRRKIRECLSEKICQQHSEKIRENFASVSLLSSCEASEDGSSSSSELSDFWDSDQEEDVTPHFVRKATTNLTVLKLHMNIFFAILRICIICLSVNSTFVKQPTSAM